jgi:hypothetical protein
MPVRLIVELPGISALLRVAEKGEKMAVRNATKETFETYADRIASIMRLQVLSHRWRGDLDESIHGWVSTVAGEERLTVGTRSGHAQNIIQGRPVTWVSTAWLKRWVADKVKPPAKQLDHVTYLIERSIRANGYKNGPDDFIAHTESSPDFKKLMDEMTKEVGVKVLVNLWSGESSGR